MFLALMITKDTYTVDRDIKDQWLGSIGAFGSMSVEDMSPDKLYDICDQIMTSSKALLRQWVTSPDNQYISEKHEDAILIRDFNILLRDSLLYLVKYTQMTKDHLIHKAEYPQDLLHTLVQASGELTRFTTRENRSFNPQWKFHYPPTEVILEQLNTLHDQSLKIYRSQDRLEKIRESFNDIQNNFFLQFDRQMSIIREVDDIIKVIGEGFQKAEHHATKVNLEELLENINKYHQVLERLHGVETIEVLSNFKPGEISLPIDIEGEKLIIKEGNISEELSRWFSAKIYPPAIDLENKRNLAIDKVLDMVNRLRIRLAAFLLEDREEYYLKDANLNKIFDACKKKTVEPLFHDANKIEATINNEFDKHLKAGRLYSREYFLFPDLDSESISNLSKDAWARLTNIFEHYKEKTKGTLKGLLSGYFDIKSVSEGAYISNRILIDEEEEQFSLFLKKGYLGRSFTVYRPEPVNKILEEYKLWQQQILGAVLVYGETGYGKRTILGMLNNSRMDHEIVHLRAGEITFVKRDTIDPSYDLGFVLDKIIKIIGTDRIIISIERLEMWHHDNHSLYSSINALHQIMVKYKKRVFFIVSCSMFLRERLMPFRDLDTLYSLQLRIGKMNIQDIAKALEIREKANWKLNHNKETAHDYIMQIAKKTNGHIGEAMLEYCRMSREDYMPDLYSNEFNTLVRKNSVFFEFLLSRQIVSITQLKDSLEMTDFYDIRNMVNWFCSQQLLIRPQDGKIAVNPLLVHDIERILVQIKEE